MTMKYIVLTINDPKVIKQVKTYLEEKGWLGNRKIDKIGKLFYIYTTLNQLDEYLDKFAYDYYEYEQELDFEGRVNQYLMNRGNHDSLVIPKKYSIYPPLLLFSTAFNFEVDDSLCKYILSLVSPDLTHIAVNQPIVEHDIMRRPFNITPLFGDFGPLPNDQVWDHPSDDDFASAFWCLVVQNGIFQTWSPKFTMFSRGNVKEKKRVLLFANIDNVVFDLYCGIGYFSLSYLKAGAKEVFAWELNPWSVQGFTRGLTKNGFNNYKVFHREDPFDYLIYLNLKDSGISIFIFQENNQEAAARLATFPKNTLSISHINLGLLPSSQPSWQLSKDIAALSKVSPVIHIHENVHVNEFDGLRKLVERRFGGEILHLERVKTFAPDVWHVVVDLQSLTIIDNH